MISRIWHGWTTPENADAYEALLKREIFTGIQNRNIPGYRGIQLLRRQLTDEVGIDRHLGVLGDVLWPVIRFTVALLPASNIVSEILF